MLGLLEITLTTRTISLVGKSEKNEYDEVLDVWREFLVSAIISVEAFIARSPNVSCAQSTTFLNCMKLRYLRCLFSWFSFFRWTWRKLVHVISFLICFMLTDEWWWNWLCHGRCRYKRVAVVFCCGGLTGAYATSPSDLVPRRWAQGDRARICLSPVFGAESSAIQ